MSYRKESRTKTNGVCCVRLSSTKYVNVVSKNNVLSIRLCYVRYYSTLRTICQGYLVQNP